MAVSDVSSTPYCPVFANVEQNSVRESLAGFAPSASFTHIALSIAPLKITRRRPESEVTLKISPEHRTSGELTRTLPGHLLSPDHSPWQRRELRKSNQRGSSRPKEIGQHTVRPLSRAENKSAHETGVRRLNK